MVGSMSAWFNTVLPILWYEARNLEFVWYVKWIVGSDWMRVMVLVEYLTLVAVGDIEY